MTSSLLAVGCHSSLRKAELPGRHELVCEPLVIHTDFYLPQHHPLLQEMIALRATVASTLEIPFSSEPIQVYLFENERQFRRYAKRKLTGFPDRRAFFIKSDKKMTVIAYWGDFVVEDLRHELTHGYLHASLSDIPLWLDEGIAECFEVPEAPQGINRPHVQTLATAFRKQRWQPDLHHLESIPSDAELTQSQYAESWLWVHFLLTHDVQSKALLCQTLNLLRETGKGLPLAPQIESSMPDWERQIIAHLKHLADDRSAEEQN